MTSFLTIAEAAECLDVSARTIRRRIKDGSIRKSPLAGRAVRIPATELERLAYGAAAAPAPESEVAADDHARAPVTDTSAGRLGKSVS